LKSAGGRALRARQTTKEEKRESETTTIRLVTFLREATRPAVLLDAIQAFASRLARDGVKCHDGTALPPELRERLMRECERLTLAEHQLAALEKTRQASVPAAARKRSEDLARLKGIGEVGASRLALELFWREFSNRRQVGACVGLVPQPWDSGESHTDQGISRQGNRRVRALLVEMAWTWLRYQPGSALTQ
jgi:transposase